MDTFDYFVNEAIETMGLTREEAEQVADDFYDMDFMDYID